LIWAIDLGASHYLYVLSLQNRRRQHRKMKGRLPMPPWQSETIHANNIRLHYYSLLAAGTATTRPALVLAHGITDNGYCWGRLAEVLAEGYDIYALDARGHGRSDRPPLGYSPADHAADLAGFIRALGLVEQGRQIGVMGHSMGADSAAHLAMIYPELLQTLILEDPPWHPLDQPDWEAQQAIRRQARAAQLEAWQQMTREKLLEHARNELAAWAPEEIPYWIDAKYEVSPLVNQFTPTRDWSVLARGLHCPTLLITGEPALGAIVTPEVAATIQELNPRVQIAHCTGAGHNVRREAFDQVHAAVAKFLAATLATS
jgi:N-formylmaleamate deformylase